MNARYYMPEIGRFVSADTIVPEPKEPQSFNRYSYTNNSPVNFTDPTGHCINNYEIGSEDMDTCVAGWSAVTNYLTGAAYGPGGSGHFPNELVNDWLLNADIGTLENLMEVMGISYGYTWTPPQGYTASGWREGKSLTSPEFRAGMCDYWQTCYDPWSEYASIGVSVPYIPSPTLIVDQWHNYYISITWGADGSLSMVLGNVKLWDDGKWKDIESLAVDQREAAAEEFIAGWGASGCASLIAGGCIAGSGGLNHAWEVGALTPGAGYSANYTLLVYDHGNPNPWFFQR